MTPTRPATLLGLAAAFVVLGYLLVDVAYGSLPALPLYAPVTLVLLGVVEVGMARVIRERLAGRGAGADRLATSPRPLHPLQVARAAVLAKASSTTGAVLLGGYAGVLAWTLPRRDELALADRDAAVAGFSVLASLGVVAAALLLERACRTTDERR